MRGSRPSRGEIWLAALRTLDRQRLVQRLGAVNRMTLQATLAALREMFEE